ncbi:MAG: hypothetical protein ACTHJG_02280 [Rhodanobacteraceae bacterium]
MKISMLNVAVLVEFAGVLVLGFSHSNVLRIVGVAIIIVGAVLYRREQKRLKSTKAQELSATELPKGSRNNEA